MPREFGCVMTDCVVVAALGCSVRVVVTSGVELKESIVIGMSVGFVSEVAVTDFLSSDEPRVDPTRTLTFSVIFNVSVGISVNFSAIDDPIVVWEAPAVLAMLW